MRLKLFGYISSWEKRKNAGGTILRGFESSEKTKADSNMKYIGAARFRCFLLSNFDAGE